jgi:hypothetical protein
MYKRPTQIGETIYILSDRQAAIKTLENLEINSKSV